MMITNTYSLKKPSQNSDFNGYFPMKVFSLSWNIFELRLTRGNGCGYLG